MGAADFPRDGLFESCRGALNRHVEGLLLVFNPDIAEPGDAGIQRAIGLAPSGAALWITDPHSSLFFIGFKLSTNGNCSPGLMAR